MALSLPVEPQTPRKDDLTPGSEQMMACENLETALTGSSPSFAPSPFAPPNAQPGPMSTHANHRHDSPSTDRSRENSTSTEQQRRVRSATMTSHSSFVGSESKTALGERVIGSTAEDVANQDEDGDDGADDQGDQDWKPGASRKSSKRSSSAGDSSGTVRSRETSTSSRDNAGVQKRSHRRKMAEGHIKRPPNAFILFRAFCSAPTRSMADHNGIDPPGKPTAEQLASLNILDHRHISRIVSHLWKNLSVPDRTYWEDLAKRKKREHAQMYPEYRYKPVFRNKEQVRKTTSRTKRRDRVVQEVCAKVASELLAGAKSTASEAVDAASAPLVVDTVPSPSDDPKNLQASPPAATVFSFTAPLSPSANVPTSLLPEPIEPQPVSPVSMLDPANAIHVQHRKPWTFETLRKAMQGEPDLPPPYPSLPCKIQPAKTGKFVKRKQPRQRKTQPAGHNVNEQPSVYTHSTSTHPEYDSEQFKHVTDLDNRGLLQTHVRKVVEAAAIAAGARAVPQSSPSLDPSAACSPMSRSTSASRGRKAPPAPLELDAPTFSSIYRLPSPMKPGSTTRSDDTATQLASFTFGTALRQEASPDIDVTPKATSSGAFSNLTTLPNLRARFSITSSPTSDRWRRQSLVMGMRRRGTIELVSSSTFVESATTLTPDLSDATTTAVKSDFVPNVRADLMLISPIAPTFDGQAYGRRFSLGRWGVDEVEAKTGQSSLTSKSDTSIGPSIYIEYVMSVADAQVFLASGIVTPVSSSATANATVFSVEPDYLSVLTAEPFKQDFVDLFDPLATLRSLSEDADDGGCPAMDMQDLSMAVDDASDESGRPWTATSNSSWSTTKSSCSASRPGSAASDNSDKSGPLSISNSAGRQLDPEAPHKLWMQSHSFAEFGAQMLDPGSTFHVGSQEYFRSPPATVLATHDSQETQESSVSATVAIPDHPPINSAAFGGSFEPLTHAQSVAQSMKLQHHAPAFGDVTAVEHMHQAPKQFGEQEPSPFNPWSWRRQTLRGSDATLRGRQDSIARLAAPRPSHHHFHSLDPAPHYVGLPIGVDESTFSFNVPSQIGADAASRMAVDDDHMRTLQFELDNPERQLSFQSQQEQHATLAFASPAACRSSISDFDAVSTRAMATRTTMTHVDLTLPGAQLPQGVPVVQNEAMKDVVYIYLTRDQAKDAQLVDSFLRLGYGVTFDR
ncbi:slightly ste11-like protein [Microbotryomycetes sp. JL201]|nr:slightly ste11-like protein [Microbotryomycetes sp. JL201]